MLDTPGLGHSLLKIVLIFRNWENNPSFKFLHFFFWKSENLAPLSLHSYMIIRGRNWYRLLSIECNSHLSPDTHLHYCIWTSLKKICFLMSAQHRAQHGAWTHELWDHDLSQSWKLNPLSHPGAPYMHFSLLFLLKLGLDWNSLFHCAHDTCHKQWRLGLWPFEIANVHVHVNSISLPLDQERHFLLPLETEYTDFKNTWEWPSGGWVSFRSIKKKVLMRNLSSYFLLCDSSLS